MLGVYFLVVLALLLGDRRGDGSLGVGGLGLLQVKTASEDLLRHGLGGLGSAWDDYLDLVDVRRENEQLRAELHRMRDENTRLLGVMQENARLRALVGFAEAHPQMELVPGTVVAKDVSPFFRVVSVRLHVRDPRLVPGLPVVSSGGVVGHVSELAGPYAEVMLTVDPRSSIDVLVQHNRARGVLQGVGHSDDYSARIAYLLRRDQISGGDIVVTSGMGGRYPADIVVGRVSAVGDANYGLFQEASIEPAVDFSRLEEVFVIVGER